MKQCQKCKEIKYGFQMWQYWNGFMGIGKNIVTNLCKSCASDISFKACIKQAKK